MHRTTIEIQSLHNVVGWRDLMHIDTLNSFLATVNRVEGGWGPWYKIPNQALVPISKSNLMFLKVIKTGPKTKIKNFN